MMYLKPIIKKLVSGESNSKELAIEALKLTNDKDLLSYFENTIGIEKVETVFTQHYGIEYRKLKSNNIDRNIINKFDLNLLKKEKILPLFYDENTSSYHFAISNLIDRKLRERLKNVIKANSQNILFYFAFEYEILNILDELETEESFELKDEVRPAGEDFSATDWVNNVIDKGIELEASDIHIEKLKDKIQLRYRVDGLLTNKKSFLFNESEMSSIYVRLKIVSNMDIVESRKSQDGRIDSYKHRKGVYDLRVNTVNTIYGEKFVMRIISKSDNIATFSELGFTKKNEETVLNMLKQKNGIIYLAGATGSGKTTTLYSMIDELNNDYVNIYTIENPVEKTINNVNQIQIDEASGTDYPTILSALLRQDPNIIVVGEIRDSETAELSIRASLTGHLVITTLHANNALDSLSRLSDMGMENYLIGASSIGFLSQVLIRKLCPDCKVKKESLSEHEELWIKDEIPEFNYSAEKEKGNYIFESVGCDNCTDGHKGRIAVVELLSIDSTLRTMISKGESIDEIRKHVISNGHESLKKDGIDKVVNGIIGIEELIGQL